MNKTSAKLDAVPYYRDIRDAFGQPGCPICRLLTRSADRQLDAILWEMVNDPATRAELNRARGYCQQHGWLLVRAGAGLGVAILMRDVVKTLLDVTQANPVEDAPESVFQGLRRSLDLERDYSCKATARLGAALEPEAPCPVCKLTEGLEKELIRTLLAHLDEPGGLAEVYQDSDGLCLAHFSRAVARVPSRAAARLLVAAQEAVWQRLHGELGEFIRKKDYRFKDEPFGPERDSWRRALAAISGPQPLGESARGGLMQSM
jgi:hypothetical protein